MIHTKQLNAVLPSECDIFLFLLVFGRHSVNTCYVNASVNALSLAALQLTANVWMLHYSLQMGYGQR